MAGQNRGNTIDGNIQPLGASYTYDADTYRAVSVSTAAIMAALASIYHADRLVEEPKH